MPGRRQAIISTNAGLSLIGPLGTHFSEILIEILIFSFQKMHLKVSSGKWQPFCLGLNVLSIKMARGHYLNQSLNASLMHVWVIQPGMFMNTALCFLVLYWKCSFTKDFVVFCCAMDISDEFSELPNNWTHPWEMVYMSFSKGLSFSILSQRSHFHSRPWQL